MPNSKSKKFDFIMLQAIDEALSTLGESVKKSVYFHLETTYKLERHQIPQKIDKFSNSLDNMFGAGARYLEILIMKKFYPKIQAKTEWNGPDFILPTLSFKEYIELTKKEYCKTQVKGKIEFFIDTPSQEQFSEPHISKNH